MDDKTAGRAPAGPLWSIVLAGGDGTRLARHAEATYGYARAKQFCALLGPQTLLEQTVHRAEHLVPRRHIVVSTTRRWRAEATECLARTPGVRWVEQPANAGTAPGLITALLEILHHDPDARVLVLPADHYVSDDRAFVRAAVLGTVGDPPPVVLLGAHLEEPEEGLGWIVPGQQHPGAGWSPVDAFVEKPDLAKATALHAHGALANTFAMIASGPQLAALLARRVPHWWTASRHAFRDTRRTAAMYRSLPACDLSHEVLQTSCDSLGVATLADVVWSDIGTLERLRAVESLRGARSSDPTVSADDDVIDWQDQRPAV